MILLMISFIVNPYQYNVRYILLYDEIENRRLSNAFQPHLLNQYELSSRIFLEPGFNMRKDDMVPFVSAGGEIRYERFNFLYEMKINYIGDYRNPISDSINYDGHVWKNKIIEEDRYGFAIYEQQYYSIFGGLSPINSGPLIHSSLIFSENARSIPLFGFKLKNPYLHFTYFFTNLEANRYLSYHRLELNKKWFFIGITETVLYTHEKPRFEYLNPFFLYYAIQWNNEWDKTRNDNIIWDADFGLLYKNIKIYWEILIDDIMYEPTPAPNKIGYGIGTYINFNKYSFLMEYIFVDKWVYTHSFNRNNIYVRYLERDTVRGWALGDSVGPDGDHIHFDVLRRIGNNNLSFLLLQISYYRKGEGNLWTPYKQGENTDPPFPSGIVEKTFNVKLGFRYLSNFDRFSIDIGYEVTKNSNNEENNSSYGFLINAGIRKYIKIVNLN